MSPKQSSSPANRVSAAVMAHPDRLAAAEGIAAATGLTSARVALDPCPDGPPTAMRSARVAFASADERATHHLVLQDDVAVPVGFAAAVGHLVDVQPDAVLSLFAEWGSRTATLVRWAAFLGASFVPMINPYVPTQAVVMPRCSALDAAAFLRDDATLEEPDDMALLRFVRARGLEPLVAVPNLVEHLDRPSLTRNDDHGLRHASCLGPDAAAWGDGSVLDAPRLVPYAPWYGDGVAVLIDPTQPPHTDHRRTGEVLSVALGSGRPLEEAFARHLAGQGVEPGAFRDRLYQVWLTAAAMGAVQEDRWPGTGAQVRGRTTEPVARHALETLTPGALRRWVSPSVLAPQRGRLAEMMLDAIELGARDLAGAIR